MPYYLIKTNRFAEWNEGDIAAIDDESARVPLENGEIILVPDEVNKEAEEVKKKPNKTKPTTMTRKSKSIAPSQAK
jgi:hypothetical protein